MKYKIGNNTYDLNPCSKCGNADAKKICFLYGRRGGEIMCKECGNCSSYRYSYWGVIRAWNDENRKLESGEHNVTSNC